MGRKRIFKRLGDKLSSIFDGLIDEMVKTFIEIQQDYSTASGRDRRRLWYQAMSQKLDQRTEWGNGPLGLLIEAYDDKIFYFILRVPLETIYYFFKLANGVPGLQDVLVRLILEGADAFEDGTEIEIVVRKSTMVD